jgi:peptidyl-prolyl cis-trans isomerase D
MAAIRERLNALKAEATAKGNFAELATANSEDPGSAHSGGDLGWFGEDENFVEPFKSVVLAMPVDTISDVVETQFGLSPCAISATSVDARRSPRPSS